MDRETGFLIEIDAIYRETGLFTDGDLGVWKISDNPQKLAEYVSSSTDEREKARQGSLAAIAKRFGRGSVEFRKANLFCQLAPHVDNILVKQLADPRPNASWADYSPEDVATITSLLKDYGKDSSAQLLETIIRENDPKKLVSLAREMDRLQATSSTQNKPMLYSAYADDYVSPERIFSEERTLWLANLLLLIPVSNSIRSRFNNLNQGLWEKVAMGFGLEAKSVTPPPLSLFFSILGAGTEIISPMIAQASEERGIQIFVNRFAKVWPYWKVMEEMSGMEFTRDKYWEAIRLFIAHEMGHDASNYLKLDGSDSTLDESETDHLASAIMLRDFLDANSVIFALTTENIFQILTANPNASGKILGYEVTATLNLNALFASKLVSFDRDKMSLYFDAETKNIKHFVEKMEKLHSAVVHNDRLIKDEMLKTQASPQVRDMLEGFRSKLKLGMEQSEAPQYWSL